MTNCRHYLLLAGLAGMFFLAGCTMSQGDATLSSQGDGLHLGGNLGLQVGGSEHNGPAH
jgi:hypothetical protein